MDELDSCSVVFLKLCQFLEKLQGLKGKQKTMNLQRFFANSNVRSFFPIVRLMVPNYDMERGQYGLKETTLGKLYAELLSLPTKEKEALVNYKNPKKQIAGCPAGGFVEVLEFVLSKRIGDSKGLTVEQVNLQLDKLVQCIDKNDKKKVLRNLLVSMNSLEQKWLVKIILKDMKLGTHDKILGTFHEKALEVYFHTNNLREVFMKLRDKNADLNSRLYSVGQPIRPMLAGRKSYQELKKILSSADAIVETKLDGERIQCHIDINGDFFLFSRNAVDYTAMYGKSLKDTILTHIKGVNSCILDGELIVWDIENNKPCRFGQNKTVAIDETPGKALCYKVFDVVYVEAKDGSVHDLMPRPLSERKVWLDKIITPVANRFEVLNYTQVKGSKAVFDLFNKAIEDNEEGIIVKSVDSPYIPDDRSNLWMKIKSEYFEALSDTLDLLIVGGYYGTGFRAVGEDEFDHITVFLTAIASKVDLKDPLRSKFIPITKVGTGYSLQELSEIRQGLRDQWKPFRQAPDYWPKWSPGPGERPDYYIKDPSKSIILEVKAAEIVPSEKFPLGSTLRFPKTHKVRQDKSWEQTTTLSEFNSIMETSSRGLTEKTAKIEETQKQSVVTKRAKKESSSKGDVLISFRDTDTQGVAVKSALFSGIEFFVVRAENKQEIETLIVANGGSKVQNLMRSTNYVIASDISSIRVQNLINKKDLNILYPNWVFDCVKYDCIQDLLPKYVAHASFDLKASFDKDFTKYGDCLKRKFRDPLEVYEMAMLVEQNDIGLTFKKMKMPWWEGLPKEISVGLKEIPGYRLIGCCFWVNGQGIEKELCEVIVKSRHGEVTERLSKDVTHVVDLTGGFVQQGPWMLLDYKGLTDLLEGF